MNTMLMGWKIQHSKDINSPTQVGLQIKHNSYKNPQNFYIYRQLDSKMYKDQQTRITGNNFKKEK